MTDINKRKLFVGNLPWEIRGDQLRDMFSEVGQVTDAFVSLYKDTGRSRGFGFVEFATDEDAAKAIEKFHGFELDGRRLQVNVAQPKFDKQPE